MAEVERKTKSGRLGHLWGDKVGLLLGDRCQGETTRLTPPSAHVPGCLPSVMIALMIGEGLGPGV